MGRRATAGEESANYGASQLLRPPRGTSAPAGDSMWWPVTQMLLCVITGREKSISIGNKGEKPDLSPAAGMVSMDGETGHTELGVGTLSSLRRSVLPSCPPSNANKDPV